MKAINTQKILFLVLIICSFNINKPQMTIFPNDYRAPDNVWGDELTIPIESNRWVAYAWSVGTTGYRDERLGIYYEPNRVSWNILFD